MKLPKTRLTTLKKALVGLGAMFLSVLTAGYPVMAAQDGGFMGDPTTGTPNNATTTIVLYLTGKKTNGAISVPLQDGITAQPEVNAMCHYGQAYAVKWTLSYDGTTVDTRSEILDETTLQPAGSDTWEIDLDTIGAGYGEYTLTCVVQGNSKDTNTTTFSYVPVKVTELEKDKNGDPIMLVDRELTNVTKVRYTLQKSGRSDVVIVDDKTSSHYTVPMASYDLPTGTYTLIAEGGDSDGWLGNTYTTSISYTKPDGSGVPSTDGERSGSAAIGAAAAGAVIMGAGKSSRKRNKSSN